MIRATALVLASLAVLALGACSKAGSDGASGSGGAAAPPPAPLPAAALNPPAGMIPLQITDPAGKPVSGDPALGKQVFVVCQACHALQSGQNRVGPSLHGVIGRKAGTVPGFAYSSANKGSGLTWSQQELYSYLENPTKTVPGTYMTFVGVKDPQQRADVIAYLQVATQ
ncbi:MAG TPA: cytochrome c family protein [Caulobacteraceae bacterium]|jgi:cytochrome c|nr:cytochrome c family protein [Caulobacteraceae bacterium]